MKYAFHVAVLITVYFSNEVQCAKKCAWLKAENAKDDCVKELLQQTLQNYRGKSKFTEQPLDNFKIDRVYFHIVNLIAGIEVELTDLKFFGYTWSTVTDVAKNVDGWTYVVKTHTPLLRADMTYEMAGRIFEAPLFGKGPAKFIYENATVTHKVKMEKVSRESKKYLKIVEYSLDIEPDNFVTLVDHLIDGHPNLSLINKIHLADNSNILFAAGKEQLLGGCSPIFQEMINTAMFNNIPFNDIFEDY